MTDVAELIERLRRGPVWSDGEPIGAVVGEVDGAIMDEAASTIEALSERIAVLEGALNTIHEARLRKDGQDVGYGWNITKLNRAMDAALPLLGKSVPPKPEIDAASLTPKAPQ